MLIKASNGLIADNIIDSPGFGGIAVSPDYDSIYVSLPPSFYFFILFYLFLTSLKRQIRRATTRKISLFVTIGFVMLTIGPMETGGVLFFLLLLFFPV
jgi:hypothetical protein